ncbi:FAST kinase domain-containing protein 5, mitochondrial [Spea bombifrons]|uniref:FAST kinase domain-containing protein 5, mitochondrial n=1 Tax=Spea bombifrons TaxID=233779 RepID=UPI00234AE202|nr:FAST kinase domain-containing protein 5, mitochondrial [Spea bombifrons]
MATVICRRMRGGIYQASTFSSTVRWSKKRTPNENGTSYTFHPAKDASPSEETRNKTNRIESQVLYNPSAYVGFTRLKAKRTEEYEACPSENGYAASNAKQTQNTYSITCSRSLSSTKNNILDLAFSGPDLAQPKTEEKSKEVQESKDPADFLSVIEAYSSKDDPRAFQQQRPEYRSLCYNNILQNVATSVEEGQSLLQKVTVLKSNLTPAQISSFLEKLSRLPVEEIEDIRSSTKFSMLCRYSVENIQMFSTAELIDVLRSFTRLGIPPAHSMLNVYQAEFSRRVWNMTTDESLLVADMWRFLGRSVPQFLEILYSCMELRWKDLTLPQLIQLIYIIGEGRRAPQELMQKLESMVLRYMDSINMEEIGTVCLGYFKSRSGLSEYLMRRFGDRVSQNMEEVSNYALVNVLKMFRYTHVDHLPFLKQLGQVVPKRIPHMGVQGIMHVALSCTALHYLDENIMNAIAAAVPDRIAYCRSKDLAKFLWSFGALNYEPPNAKRFYVVLTDEIRKRRQEFEKFPEHFLTSLMGLVFARQFPIDLLKIALSERFVEQATKNELFELKKDLFTIAGSVDIECPNYKGSRLSPGLRQEVTEMLRSFASQDICLKPEVVEAAGLLESMLGGTQYVKNHMILHHTRSSDLEVHLDHRGKPLPINQEPAAPEVDQPELKPLHVHLTDDLLHQILDRKKYTVTTETVATKPKQHDVLLNETAFSVKDNLSFAQGVPITEDLLTVLTKPQALHEKPLSPPKLDVTKLAIQVSHRNHYCYGSRHLLGLHNLKRRQLRRLGYVVIELPYWEWLPLTKRTRSEKLAYLHQKVYGSLSDRV